MVNKEIINMINELEKAKAKIQTIDKDINREYYMRNINLAMALLKTGDRTLAGMYEANKILAIIDNLTK